MPINPQHVILFHHFRQFLVEAARHGIDVAPLKGAYLIDQVYPQNEDRGALADIDFLVRERDWDATCSVLAELGFLRRSMVEGRGVTELEFHEAGFIKEFDSKRRILFEPHRSLVQPKRHFIDYEALWQRTSAGTCDGAPCRHLAPEDHVLHTVIHALSHNFLDPGRFLRDLEYLITRLDVDLDVVVDRSTHWECSRATWLALSLLREAVPCLDFETVIQSIAPPWTLQRLVRFAVPDANGFRFRSLGLRAREAILFPLLLDGWGPQARFVKYYGGLRWRDYWADRKTRQR